MTHLTSASGRLPLIHLSPLVHFGTVPRYLNRSHGFSNTVTADRSFPHRDAQVKSDAGPYRNCR
jgi:hypothetical protein